MDFLPAPVRNCEIFYSIPLSLSVLVVLLYLIRRSSFKSFESRLGVVLILSGGILNIVERVFTGCVRDYINFFELFHFNFFDLLVTSGAFLLIYGLWKNKK